MPLDINFFTLTKGLCKEDIQSNILQHHSRSYFPSKVPARQETQSGMQTTRLTARSIEWDCPNALTSQASKQ